jgi:hypothetical protein
MEHIVFFWGGVGGIADVLVDADVSEKYTVSIFQGWRDKAGKERAYIGPEWQGLTQGRQPEGRNI